MKQTSYAEKQMADWMEDGPASGAFMLIIPGIAIFSGGLGWLFGSPWPYAIMGIGAGMAIWGFIVAFRRRKKSS